MPHSAASPAEKNVRMAESDPKADLHRYLRDAREAMLWKLTTTA